MEAKLRSSSLWTIFYQLFEILHICTTIGLVVMVVHNHMMYGAKFEKLENDVKPLTTRNHDQQWTENVMTRSNNDDVIVKRSVNNQQERKENRNTRKQDVQDLKNDSFQAQSSRIAQDEYDDVKTCLDLLDKFLRDNDCPSGKRTETNQCKILRGPPGRPGRRGPRGKRGPKGRPGDKGNIGKHGPPGPRGEKGFSGNVTVIGLKGDMGPKGTKGDRGDTGMKGQKGAQGPKGGFGGQKGEQGQRGPKGEVGPRGCPGDTFAPPSFFPSPRVLVFKEQDPAVLFCNATANPYSRITWYRDNLMLSSEKDSPEKRYEVKENVTIPTDVSKSCNKVTRHPVTESSLVIKRSRSNDTGHYICEARNVMGVFRYQIRLLIQVYVKFTSIPSSITVVENEDIQLSCRASGVPIPVITWYRKDGGAMPKRFRIVQGDLHITSVTKEQEGSYVCVASNVLGARKTEATITVNVSPAITFFHEQLVTVNEYQNLTLPCNATGYPKPLLEWHKSNGSLPRGRYMFDSKKLKITNAQYEDGGEYICTANNTVGIDSQRTRVIVQVGPKVRRKPKKLEHGYRGKRKLLHLDIFAFPKAIITWKKLDNTKMNDRFRKEAGNLVIETVQFTDAGLYQATAKNLLGEAKVTTFLVVRDPVSPWITSIEPRQGSKLTLDEGTSLLRTCFAKGIPEPSLVWKFKNKILTSEDRNAKGGLTLMITNISSEHAGRYTCEANNDFGSASQYFDLAVKHYLRIFVQSEGCDDNPGKRVGCGTCMIKVNNVEYCPNRRGHNIVVLDKFGAYQKRANFDTYDDGSAGRQMKTFLDGLPHDRIVLIAVKDSGEQYVGDAEAALRSAGAVNPAVVSYRGSWLLVGYKGGSPSWITEKRADRYKGPSQAKVTIPVTVN